MKASVAGKVALVAGGTGGLGRAVSLSFLEEGATVIVTYRSPDELAALKAAAGANANRLDGREVDVTDEQAVRGLVEAIRARHGRLDALVNAVGGYAGGMPLWEQDARLLDRMLNLNLRSGFTLLRAAVPVMLSQGHGVDRERGLDGRARSRRRKRSLRRLEGGGRGSRGFPGRRPERHRREGEFDSPKHHRHGGESKIHAKGGLLEVADARGDRPRRPLPRQRRREARSRRSDPRVKDAGPNRYRVLPKAARAASSPRSNASSASRPARSRPIVTTAYVFLPWR